MTKNKHSSKIEALASFLECEVDDITEGADDSTFETGRQKYKVFTDEEADAAARDAILDLVWAFNADFLADWVEMDTDTIAVHQDRCESSNAAFLRLIGKENHQPFVDAAIGADGRGHFLAGYDDEENEAGQYFIYRTN